VTRASLTLIVGVASLTVGTPALHAQGLNWEGQTGGIVTPTANVSASESGRAGAPAIAFHVLDAGDVISTHFRLSVTMGFAERVEVGFTRAAVFSGEDSALGSLFDRGYSIVHGKVNLVRESDEGLPGISAGAAVRWQVEHLEGALGVATQNADVYVAATKAVAVGDQAAVLLNGGVKFTNASLLGLAGNAPDWTPVGFVSGAVDLADTVLVGAEWLQHPADIEGVPNADVPGTITLFARIGVGRRVSIDAAFVRLADEIAPGVDVKATSGFLAGVSYSF